MRVLILILISVFFSFNTAYAKWTWFKSKAKSEVQTNAASLPTEKTAPEVSIPVLPPVPSNPTQLVIADFDTGDKPNNLGGDFGSWNKDPEDSTQSCAITFEMDDALQDPAGYALKIDYDVDSPNPAYNGVWMKLNGQDVSEYSFLSFYVRGEGLRNYTKRIKLELKDSEQNNSPYLVSGITESWQKIQVPLDRFKKVKNWKAIEEFVIVFDDRNSSPKQGTLLVDQIAFEKK